MQFQVFLSLSLSLNTLEQIIDTEQQYEYSFSTFAEYGISEQTSCGDVYSFAILLLEMFTGRTPTNQLFKDDLNLHNFAKLTLPGRVTEIYTTLRLVF